MRAMRPQEGAVIDRQKVETILARRFPAVTRDQVAVSANALRRPFGRLA